MVSYTKNTCKLHWLDFNGNKIHSRQIFLFCPKFPWGAVSSSDQIAFSARIDQSDAVISLLPRFAARFRPFWVPTCNLHLQRRIQCFSPPATRFLSHMSQESEDKKCTKVLGKRLSLQYRSSRLFMMAFHLPSKHIQGEQAKGSKFEGLFLC